MGRQPAKPIMEHMRTIRGNKCLQCGKTNDLQFAHVRPTGVKGSGRGLDKRMRDIRHHPNDYILLCKSCHLILDSLHKNLTSKKEGGGV